MENSVIDTEKTAAVEMLKKDFRVIARNAARVGRSVSEYLTGIGFDPDTAKYFAAWAKESGKGQEQVAPPPPELRVNLNGIANTESVNTGDKPTKNAVIDFIVRQFRGVDSLLKTLAVVALVLSIVCMVCWLVERPGRYQRAGRYQMVAMSVGYVNDAVVRLDTVSGKLEAFVPDPNRPGKFETLTQYYEDLKPAAEGSRR